ncbi:cytochrome c oxidase subunit 3 [Methylocaldum sp.]|uniref:cytochrome c oxidase subunit 3 n=1 Tax=Methylocaldum sp. TaxID=1969727 RepID=UPI002D62E6F0|nr:cytochrome c oxidase subunit 3 [Methylocaldum sp.]HYE34088.1 cytochrome c oxidase subunit 3 [Methylocaldum sp.]
MSSHRIIDVSQLPSYVFGSRSLMWWGTLGIIAIEGTVFALVLASYFYLRQRTAEWPPGGLPAPKLLWDTLNTLVLLVSLVPNYWTDGAAKRHDLRAVRIGLPVCLGFAIVFLIIRAFEFGALNIRWDNNAYGSIVWIILGLHTVHLAIDAAVLTVLMFTGPLEGRRFSDVSDNAFYWYFVVLAWIPLYAVVYSGPRWL